MGEPWWITAARLAVVLGMGWGAFDGFRRWRIEQKKKQAPARGERTPERKEG